MSTEAERSDGYQLRPVGRLIAGVVGIADLALVAVFVFGFLLPVLRSYPAVPLELGVRAAVFLLIAALAQILLVPLSLELYRFPE